MAVYTGSVLGKKKLNKNWLYYVETSRYPTDVGIATDVVFAKYDIPIGDIISYRVFKTKGGYIARA